MLLKEYKETIKKALCLLETLPTKGSSDIARVLEYNSYFLDRISTAKAHLEVAIMDLENEENNLEIHVYEQDFD